MGALKTYIASGKYKVWQDVVWQGSNSGIIMPTSEIKPIPGSKIKLFDILRVTIVDDVGIGIGKFNQYFYLYDFEKYGAVHTKYSYRRPYRGSFTGNRFYDSSLEGKLGGDRQTLG